MSVTKGRWGFHPCTYELYRKLKRLNYLAFLARRRSASWERWNRKLPQNRVIRRYVAQAGVQNRSKKEIVGKWFEPATIYIDWDLIYDDYRRARYPAATAEEVKKLILDEAWIDTELKRMEVWYAGPQEIQTAA